MKTYFATYSNISNKFNLKTGSNEGAAITKAINTNTIWVESEEGKKDFKPINASPGEVVLWDGSNLLHGNKENKEKFTRVSMDFRVMKLKNYIPLNKGSINTNTKFEIGGYYEQI